jgi:hypothetical protein
MLLLSNIRRPRIRSGHEQARPALAVTREDDRFTAVIVSMPLAPENVVANSGVFHAYFPCCPWVGRGSLTCLRVTVVYRC